MNHKEEADKLSGEIGEVTKQIMEFEARKKELVTIFSDNLLNQKDKIKKFNSDVWLGIKKEYKRLTDGFEISNHYGSKSLVKLYLITHRGENIWNYSVIRSEGEIFMKKLLEQFLLAEKLLNDLEKEADELGVDVILMIGYLNRNWS